MRHQSTIASSHMLAHAMHSSAKLSCSTFSVLVIFFQIGSPKPLLFQINKIIFDFAKTSIKMHIELFFLNIVRSLYLGNKKNYQVKYIKKNQYGKIKLKKIIIKELKNKKVKSLPWPYNSIPDICKKKKLNTFGFFLI